MSYPSIDEIGVQVKDWAFVNALPEEFKGFTKKIKIEKQGQVLFICSYLNEELRARLDIIYTSDWSLAASIILGQNAAKISRSISQVKQKINDSNFSWYSAKRFIFVIVALFNPVFFASPVLEIGEFFHKV